MTEPNRIHVTFRKAVSDANYGTESAEASFEGDIDDAQNPQQALGYWLREMRECVHLELARSPSSNVRRALDPPRRVVPPPAEPIDEDKAYAEAPF